MLLPDIRVPVLDGMSSAAQVRALMEYVLQLNKKMQYVLQNLGDDNLDHALNSTVKSVGTLQKTVEGAAKKDEVAVQIKKLDKGKLDKQSVYNGLDTSVTGYALDAAQGKALNAAKLDKSNVVNTLTESGAGKALDARQGKALNESKLAKADVVTSLDETEPGKALDATQAAALLLAAHPVGCVYLSTANTAPDFGGTWEAMTSSITDVYMWERTA